MGYFRLFYYISYIFNTVCRLIRRNGKFLLWIVCIFVFLVLCMYNKPVHAVYVGNDTYSNAEYNITKAYNSIAMDFLRRYENSVKNHTHDELSEIVRTRLSGAVYDYYLFYGSYNNRLGQDMINGMPYDTSYCFILFYPKNNGGFSVTTSPYSDYLGNFCDIMRYTATANRPSDQYFLICLDMQGIYYNYTIFNTEYFDIPSSLFHNSNEYIYNYFVNNYTLQELEILQEIEDKVASVDNTIQATQDYISSEPDENNFSSSDLPNDSGVTPSTNQGLDNYFTSIYNQLTRAPSSLYNITVYMPFTDKSFEIPYNYTATVLSGSAFSWLTTFIGAFWYYLVGRYIIIDLINKFEKIQSGNIENLENENIKEDML